MDDYPNSAQIINRFEEERGEGGSNNEENLPAGNEEEAKRLQLNPIKTTVGEKLRNHANPSLPRLQIPKPKPMSQSEKVAVVESSYSVVPTASCNGRNMTGNDGGEVGIKETVWIGPRNNRVQVHVSTQDRRETVAVCLKAHANVVYLMLFDGQRFVECRLAHLSDSISPLSTPEPSLWYSVVYSPCLDHPSQIYIRKCVEIEPRVEIAPRSDGRLQNVPFDPAAGGGGNDVVTLEVKLIPFQRDMCSTQPQREQLQQIFRENAGQCQFEFCAKQKVIRLTGRREVVEEVKRKLVSFLTNLRKACVHVAPQDIQRVSSHMASIATAHGVFIKWSNKKTLVRVRGCASEVQRAKAAIQALISVKQELVIYAAPQQPNMVNDYADGDDDLAEEEEEDMIMREEEEDEEWLDFD